MSDRDQPENQSTDAARRRLLRASAVAPLIATIPTGTAWSASVYQCVTTSQSNSGSAPASPSAPDEWVRTSALFSQFSTNSAVSGLNPPVAPLWSLDSGATWVDINGDPVGDVDTSPGCSQDSSYCPLFPPITVYVLASFQAIPDASNPTDVSLVGFYPLEKPEAQGGDPGNIALYTSCLCSVNPTLGGAAC